MTFFFAASIYIAVGYSLAVLSGLSRPNLLFNASLSWFLGTGYFALSSLLLASFFGLNPGLAVSSLIFILPPIFAVKYFRKDEPGRPLKISAAISDFSPIHALLFIVGLAILILIVSHGVSTPTSGDDALRARAYHPMLAYLNDIRPDNDLFHNGIWPNYVMSPFWQIGAGIDHFQYNYAILANFLFFLILITVAPALKGEFHKGIYRFFLTLSAPLFAFHATATYVDILLIIPFALGFVFFSDYVSKGDDADLKTSILFFTMTGFFKSKGIIAGITGFGFIFLFLLYSYFKTKNLPNRRLTFYFIPLALYMAIKEYYDPIGERLWEIIGISSDKAASIAASAASVASADSLDADIGIKLFGFLQSLFSSGNFGILFYALFVAVPVFYKRIFFTRKIWDFLFLLAVFLEVYFHSVIYPTLYEFEASVHRVVMLFSAIAALFLADCFSANEKYDFEEK